MPDAGRTHAASWRGDEPADELDFMERPGVGVPVQAMAWCTHPTGRQHYHAVGDLRCHIVENNHV